MCWSDMVVWYLLQYVVIAVGCSTAMTTIILFTETHIIEPARCRRFVVSNCIGSSVLLLTYVIRLYFRTNTIFNFYILFQWFYTFIKIWIGSWIIELSSIHNSLHQLDWYLQPLLTYLSEQSTYTIWEHCEHWATTVLGIGQI